MNKLVKILIWISLGIVFPLLYIELVHVNYMNYLRLGYISYAIIIVLAGFLPACLYAFTQLFQFKGIILGSIIKILACLSPLIVSYCFVRLDLVGVEKCTFIESDKVEKDVIDKKFGYNIIMRKYSEGSYLVFYNPENMYKKDIFFFFIQYGTLECK